MAKVSREVLKTFFQKGSKPSETHFWSLIDSFLHYAADRELLGLRNHNPSLSYSPGDTVIYNQAIYLALKSTSGAFNPQDWSDVLNAGAPASINSFFLADYEVAESTGQSFMTNASALVTKVSLNTGSRNGKHRVQWSLVASHQQAEGMGMFRLMNTTNNEVLGVALVHKQTDVQERTPLGGFILMDLDGTEKNIEIQYQTLNDGMSQYVEQARIEIFKIQSSN